MVICGDWMIKVLALTLAVKLIEERVHSQNTETQAVKSFVEQRDFKIAMNYHSYSNLLIYPFGYSYENNMDQDDLNTFIEYAQDMTQYNNYVWGTGPDILYPVNGEVV